ncbi:MAG: 3-keto-5-aminohexanoate cleavage protein [Acidimicrobiales bacterium]|nr:3-keto-5-aminohexanoate cleavage protein [Acidimicrobiales bacterium]RZV45889.1 MAG: 3-keto-5-aminohexanoate cleavage protein [Acidimicrobiales bacterium]
MHDGVFITCAVTGGGATTHKSEKVPITPEQIADACIEAAKAGAAITHIHVREDDGSPSRDIGKYAEVFERVRDSDTDVVINLTAGMGGDIVLGGVENPLPPAEDGTDMVGATERVEHVRQLRPEICTLDCGTMNFGEGDYVMTNTPSQLEEMAKQMTNIGTRIEIEAFDTGHLAHAKSLVERGFIPSPVMVQLCMGIPWGAPDDLNTFMAMRNNIPSDWTFSAFSISRNQLKYVSLAAMAGGNVRVGLEDNIYLDRGVMATNGDLVERAVTILEAQNYNILTPAQVRENLQLTKHG